MADGQRVPGASGNRKAVVSLHSTELHQSGKNSVPLSSGRIRKRLEPAGKPSIGVLHEYSARRLYVPCAGKSRRASLDVERRGGVVHAATALLSDENFLLPDGASAMRVSVRLASRPRAAIAG